MTITREQVADLQPGDVVEITELVDGHVYTLRGPVRADEARYPSALNFSDYWLRDQQGKPGAWIDTLTVVSRAPRPLYVNHPRTEPVPGDVVRDADNDEARVWLYTGAPSGAKDRYSGWCFTTGHGSVAWTGRADVGYPQLATRLRLLVDGETGQVVP